MNFKNVFYLVQYFKMKSFHPVIDIRMIDELFQLDRVSLNFGVHFTLPACLVIPFSGLCSLSFQKPSGAMLPYAIDATLFC